MPADSTAAAADNVATEASSARHQAAAHSAASSPANMHSHDQAAASSQLDRAATASVSASKPTGDCCEADMPPTPESAPAARSAAANEQFEDGQAFLNDLTAFYRSRREEPPHLVRRALLSPQSLCPACKGSCLLLRHRFLWF